MPAALHDLNSLLSMVRMVVRRVAVTANQGDMASSSSSRVVTAVSHQDVDLMVTKVLAANLAMVDSLRVQVDSLREGTAVSNNKGATVSSMAANSREGTRAANSRGGMRAANSRGRMRQVA